LVARHDEAGHTADLVDLDGDCDLTRRDALGEGDGGGPGLDEHAVDHDLTRREIVEGDLPPNGVDIGQRRGRAVLLWDIAGRHVILVDGLLTREALLDVLLDPVDLHQLGVVVGAVLHRVEIAVDRAGGHQGHDDGDDQDDCPSISH
jgi:hypothetical protein